LENARKHLSYANVTSTLALFLALGGATAFAVNQLPEKSVGAKELRPGAVTADKLRKNAVTAPKIKALAVKNGKLAGGAVTQAKLAAGAVGTANLADFVVSTAKIAPGAVTGVQLDESSVGQIPTAKTAETAGSADSANPAAFAVVDQEGNVDTSLSKGIGPADVDQGLEAGIYCVTVPSFSPRGAQVTPRYNGSGGVTAFATIGGTGSCPAPQVEVQMHNGGLVKSPFYIVLYR
jgi:hypothetical protein